MSGLRHLQALQTCPRRRGAGACRNLILLEEGVERLGQSADAIPDADKRLFPLTLPSSRRLLLLRNWLVQPVIVLGVDHGDPPLQKLLILVSAKLPTEVLHLP